MKAVAYSVRSFEKGPLALANQKKHEITLISNPLDLQTAVFAAGKDAVLVFNDDDVSAPVIAKLAGFGVKYIVTRSTGTGHLDLEAAARFGIKVAHVPSYSPHATAEQSVALAMALNLKRVQAVKKSGDLDYRIENHVGFNFYRKTVGLIGIGAIGKATAAIYHGLGCKVLGYDIEAATHVAGLEQVSLETLLEQSDIISLHAPLTPQTKHLINQSSIALMKSGVMLINASSGGLIQAADVLDALKSGQIGYLGIDVFDDERGLFLDKNPLLAALTLMPNVMVTPHQGFLTSEVLAEIAAETISHLNNWQKGKCVGNACVCAKNCRITVERESGSIKIFA